MFVGCKLPNGLSITHNGQTITLNGANVGYDADNPWRNGLAPDSALRTSGVGLTTLDGAQADAFKDWFDMAGKGPGPVSAGLIFMTERKVEADKEAQNIEGENAIAGIDPDKDLPKELSTDTDAAKNAKKG